MQNLKIHQPDYLFTEKNRAIMEENLNAKFLMDIDPGHGIMGALFFSANPDVSKGHVHYVLVRHDGRHAYISACELKQVVGILEDGIFYYSAHVHDYIRTPKGQVIDGGVYYTRATGETATLMLLPDGPAIM